MSTPVTIALIIEGQNKVFFLFFGSFSGEEEQEGEVGKNKRPYLLTNGESSASIVRTCTYYLRKGKKVLITYYIRKGRHKKTRKREPKVTVELTKHHVGTLIGLVTEEIDRVTEAKEKHGSHDANYFYHLIDMRNKLLAMISEEELTASISEQEWKELLQQIRGLG